MLQQVVNWINTGLESVNFRIFKRCTRWFQVICAQSHNLRNFGIILLSAWPSCLSAKLQNRELAWCLTLRIDFSICFEDLIFKIFVSENFFVFGARARVCVCVCVYVMERERKGFIKQQKHIFYHLKYVCLHVTLLECIHWLVRINAPFVIF